MSDVARDGGHVEPDVSAVLMFPSARELRFHLPVPARSTEVLGE